MNSINLTSRIVSSEYSILNKKKINNIWDLEIFIENEVDNLTKTDMLRILELALDGNHDFKPYKHIDTIFKLTFDKHVYLKIGTKTLADYLNNHNINSKAYTEYMNAAVVYSEKEYYEDLTNEYGLPSIMRGIVTDELMELPLYKMATILLEVVGIKHTMSFIKPILNKIEDIN